MRSIIALLIVSTFAYLAVSQTACTNPAPAGCASCTGLGALPNQCTSCSSGYLLSNSISGCATACGTGCWTCTNATICLVCSPGWALWATTGVCVQYPTGCTAGTATNATAINCTAVQSFYALNTGIPVICNGSTGTTVGANTWLPIPNCAACTASAVRTNNLLTAATGFTGYYVTCTQCALGYLLITPLAQVTAATNMGVSTPECVVLSATAITTSTLPVAAGNLVVAVGATLLSAGCAQGTVAYSTTAVTGVTCTWAASGYWCPTAALATGAPATQCQNTAATGVYPTTVPANCIGGTATTATTVITCQWCTNSSFYFTANNTAGNSCVANNASCITQVSATNCTVAATGFTIVGGLVVACSNTTTSCTGGVPTGSIMLATGATVTGTAVAGCQWHNASGVCVQCAMFITSVQNCTACPSNCVNCTMSSGTTSCSTCNSGFNLWSANGSCLTACANGTNRSSNGTCVYGKNMIASVVAFASLVFYYIF